jgi:hypothetical protein
MIITGPILDTLMPHASRVNGTGQLNLDLAIRIVLTVDGLREQPYSYSAFLPCCAVDCAVVCC